MGSTPASSPPNPYAVVERGDERRQARQVLLSMPESCRALWRLVFVERLNYREIAATLAISPGTVKSRMWYCRQKAMTALERLRSRPPAHRGGRRPID
jgi:RNA polymerase sigma factor (sigma-70 family)